MHRGIAGLSAAIAALALTVCATPSYAASFDCQRAHSANEKIICADPELSAADDKLGVVYKQAKHAAHNKTAFREASDAQWQWREKNCHDKACLLSWYQARTQELAALASDTSGTAPASASAEAPASKPAHVATKPAHKLRPAAASEPKAAANPAPTEIATPVPVSAPKPAAAAVNAKKTASAPTAPVKPASAASAPAPKPVIPAVKPAPLTKPKTAADAPALPAAPATHTANPAAADSDVFANRAQHNATISAEQLYQDYRKNRMAADAAYKGKRLQLTGEVRKVNKDINGTELILKTSDKFDSVEAHFASGTPGDYVHFAVGSQVTVNCIGNGIDLGSPTLRCQ